MRYRVAQKDDLADIVALTRARRTKLAAYAPTYFRPRAGADEMHAMFLEFLVGSDDHPTFVLANGDGPALGFCVRIEQDRHVWIDDVCFAASVEPAVGLAAISASVAKEWVTCIPAADDETAAAAEAAGLRCVSRYWARLLDAGAGTATPTDRVRSGLERTSTAASPAPHTFGPTAFSAEAEGALVIDRDGSLVIGSAGVEPAIYDPGGPTTVIDLVQAADRAAAIDEAVTIAQERGDAQLVIVVAEVDDDLHAICQRAGFEHVVSLWQARARNLGTD